MDLSIDVALEDNVNNGSSGEEEEEEAMTASEVLVKIEELWRTEKMSPSLEPHHGELIDCMLDQINQMTDNLKRCKKDDFRLAIHKLEIDRIRYIISSYLRTRLKKIELFVHYLLERESKRSTTKPPLLSPEEHSYAVDYAANLDTHLTILAAQHMPENLRSIENPTKSVKPNLESYVFFKVKKNVPGLLMEEITDEGRETVDLQVNEQHLMQYSTISHLLEEAAVNLI